MQEAEKTIRATRELIRLKKERLLKHYIEGRESYEFEIPLKQTDHQLDWERYHVESRKENFSLFSQQQ